MGSADEVLKNKRHLREVARSSLAQGIEPNDEGWGGWLGRYQSALVEASRELQSRSRKNGTYGKMQFYLAVLDDTTRLEGENASIGILICRSKDRTIVEYALRESSKPIGVATYRILSAVPVELTNDLPAPDALRACWRMSRDVTKRL